MDACVLLVDGTNLVMRASYGGETPAERAVDGAARLVVKACAVAKATHLIVAFDAEAPTWRKELLPTYKAHRSTETHQFSRAAREAFTRLGWTCVAVDGFEADDVIATLASRQQERVVICSSDSDLLACIREDVHVLRPQAGGSFELWGAVEVHAKYGVAPHQLADFKALTGEPGDNILGVRSIGAKRAGILLRQHGSLDRLLAAEVPDSSNEAARVRNEGREAALSARVLTTLRTDAPVPPISRARCDLRRRVAA